MGLISSMLCVYWIEDFRSHDMCHTCATWLVSAGVN